MSDTNKVEGVKETAEPDWMEEDRRLRAIRTMRRERFLCVQCGKPLRWFDKRAKRDQHPKCEVFKE